MLSIIDLHHPQLVIEGIQRAIKEIDDDRLKNDLQRSLKDEGMEGALRSKDLALKAMAKRVLKAKRETLDERTKAGLSTARRGRPPKGAKETGIPVLSSAPVSGKRKRCISEEEALRRCEALVIYLGTFPESALFHLPVSAALEPGYHKVSRV